MLEISKVPYWVDLLSCKPGVTVMAIDAKSCMNWTSEFAWNISCLNWWIHFQNNTWSLFINTSAGVQCFILSHVEMCMLHLSRGLQPPVLFTYLQNKTVLQMTFSSPTSGQGWTTHTHSCSDFLWPDLKKPPLTLQGVWLWLCKESTNMSFFTCSYNSQSNDRDTPTSFISNS